MPFVKDIVREDLGASLTEPASTDPAQVEFVVEDGDTAQHDRDAPRGGGPRSRPPGVRLHRHRPRADRQAPAGDLPAAQEHDARTSWSRRCSSRPAIPYVDIGLRTACGSSRSRPSSRRCPLADGLAGVLRPRDSPPDGAHRRLPVAEEDPRGRPASRAPSLEGFLWPASYRVLPGYDARGADPADARQVLRGRRRGAAEGRRPSEA